MMKKILSIVFIVIVIANVILSGTKDLNKKSAFSLALLIAKADGGDGENEPPKLPFEPIPDRIYPDSTFVFIIQ
jgi:hypothetical protein